MSVYTQTISAAANLCRWDREGAYFLTNRLQSGYHADGLHYDSSLRFTSLTDVKGKTLSSANLAIAVQTYVGTPVLILKGDDSDSASAPTSNAEGQAIVRTTASVDPGITGTGTTNVNVLPIVQEIMGRAGYTDNIQFLLDDNGSSHAATNLIQSDDVAVYSMTLTINYTAGGVPQIMIF
jgi:hypothetical protein